MGIKVFHALPTPMDIDSTGISSNARQMSLTAMEQVLFVQGDGGDVEVTSTPQIEAHDEVGATIKLIGMNDSQKLTLKNTVGGNLILSGTAVLGLNCILELLWCGDNYIELGRNF